MPSHKEKVAAAIVAAKADLDEALTELEHLPAFDPGVVGFAAHALSNYLSVADGVVELLALALQGNQDPDVHHWFQVLRQTTDRMGHTTSQLMNISVPSGPKLTLGRVDAVGGVRRACDYYQRVADRKQIRILFEPAAGLPLVRTDRVALAAVLDNLLSNAVKYSDHGKRVWVRIRVEGDSVVCAVQDEGPGLTLEDQARLFQRGCASARRQRAASRPPASVWRWQRTSWASWAGRSGVRAGPGRAPAFRSACRSTATSRATGNEGSKANGAVRYLS